MSDSPVRASAQHDAGWRDIASAPKDEPVLVSGGSIGDVGIAWQNSGGDWRSDEATPLMEPPTHWRPLPSSPAEHSETYTYTIPKRIVEIIHAGRAWVKALKDADEAKYSRDHDARVAIAASALRHLRALFEDDENLG